MVGVCAFVFVRALQEQGVGVPGRELAQYRERYGDITAKTQAIVGTRRKAQEKALTAARAAVPAGATIAADWDLDQTLTKAWLPVEQETLDGLASLFACQGSKCDLLRDYTLEDLKQRLGGARHAGNITPFEARFNPNEYGAEGVFEHFREFVLTADFLNELEAAIDFGLYQSIGDLDFDEAFDREERRGLATSLLSCRARFLSEKGEREKALKTCLRLYSVPDRLNQDVMADLWSSDTWFRSAHAALQSCLCSGPIPPDWQTQFLTIAEPRCRGHRDSA